MATKLVTMDVLGDVNSNVELYEYPYGYRNLIVKENLAMNTLLAWTTGIPSSEVGAVATDFIEARAGDTFKMGSVPSNQLFYYGEDKSEKINPTNITGGIIHTIADIPEVRYIRIVWRDNYLSKFSVDDLYVVKTTDTITKELVFNGDKANASNPLTGEEKNLNPIKFDKMKMLSSEVNELPSSLIGNKNLAPGFDKWYKFNNNFEALEATQRIISLEGKANTGERYYYVIPVKPNTTYTVSMNTAVATGAYSFIREKDRVSNDRLGQIRLQGLSGGDSIIASVGNHNTTFTTTDTTKGLLFEIGSDGSTPNFEIVIRDLKVEEDSQASPWSPHPNEIGVVLPEEVNKFEGVVNLHKEGTYLEGEFSEYPNILENGLVAWYDFNGRQNYDSNSRDLINLVNGNVDGNLYNFDFNEFSGYDNQYEYPNLMRYLTPSVDPIGFGYTRVTQIDDKPFTYKVERNEVTAGWGIILNRATTFTSGVRYRVIFEVKTTDTQKLNYNYVNSSAGNVTLGASSNTELIMDGAWHEYSIPITLQTDRIGGIMLAVDNRSALGESFEVRNVRMVLESDGIVPYRPAINEVNTLGFPQKYNGLRFDGVDDYIATSKTFEFIETDGNYTVESFLYVEGDDETKAIWNAGSGSSNRNGCNITVGGIATFATYNTEVSYRRKSVNLNLNEWNHIVCVNENGSIKIYANGIEGNGFSGVYLASNNSRLLIGANTTIADRPYFSNSAFGSFRVYNRALSPEEIKYNYEAEKGRW